MVSIESGSKQGSTPARRTDGERKRRQALADGAAGIMPSEADAPKGVDRFRVVIYLCAAANTSLAAPRRECTEYAAAFGWEVADAIEDRFGLLPPEGRDGLARALDMVEAKEVGAVLTPWRSMISTVPQGYDEVARDVEKRGGFLHVMDSDRSRRRLPC
jgi:hypothetical protein